VLQLGFSKLGNSVLAQKCLRELQHP
jgi:hypothetical protein